MKERKCNSAVSPDNPAMKIWQKILGRGAQVYIQHQGTTKTRDNQKMLWLTDERCVEWPADLVAPWRVVCLDTRKPKSYKHWLALITAPDTITTMPHLYGVLCATYRANCSSNNFMNEHTWYNRHDSLTHEGHRNQGLNTNTTRNLWICIHHINRAFTSYLNDTLYSDHSVA